jgi:hypothetical protein
MRPTRLAFIALLSLAVTLALAGPAWATGDSPAVRTVAPDTAAVGVTVGLRGSGFVPGWGRDVVVLHRAGGRAIFLRAGRATLTRIELTLPACRVLPFLDWRNHAPRSTPFSVSVLTRRLSARPAARALTILPGAPENAAGISPGTSQCLFDGQYNLAPDLSGASDLLHDIRPEAHPSPSDSILTPEHMN